MLGLGIGLSIGANNGSGGGSGPQVMQIGTRSEQNLAVSGTSTSANNKRGGRARMYFAHDCNNIQFGFGNYYNLLTSQTVTETNNANQTVMRCALEYNGMSIPFTWGGAGSATIAAGEALRLTDKLPASAFGLSKFTKGDEAWMRMEQVVPIGGTSLYHYANTNSPAITGENFRLGAESATDVLTATGDWPITGGWSAHGVVWLPQCVIGEVVGNKMASIIVGASIEHGAGETGRGDGFNLSGGYIRRGFVAGKGAKIGIMVAGESAASFVNNSAKRRQLLQYVNHAYTGHGGNDYSYGLTEASLETNMTQIWAWLKAEGIRIRHIGLFPKTTGTWADQAGQTPMTGFAVGGAWRDAFSTWALAQVGTKIDAYSIMDASMSGVPSGGTRDKWRTDLGAGSTDGVHPTTVNHTAGGTEFASIIEVDRLAYEGA